MTAGHARDVCSNLGFSQGTMEQRLLGGVLGGVPREGRGPGIRKSCLLFLQPGGGDTGVCDVIFMPLCMSGIFHQEFLRERGA